MKRQPAGRGVGGDDLLEAGLVDRHLAALEPGDLARVLVDAGDLDAEFGKAGAGDEPDITRADHRNAHDLTPVERAPERSAEAEIFPASAALASALAIQRRWQVDASNRGSPSHFGNAAPAAAPAEHGLSIDFR